MSPRAEARVCRATLLASLALVPVPLAAASPSPLEDLLASRAAAMVTVQFVLDVKIGGTAGVLMGEQQNVQSEATCVTIAPDGLILCSNTQLGGYMGITERLMGRMGVSADIVAAPTQLKVLLPDDATPRPARLLGRDTDLDLAWVQLTEPPDGLPYFDFTRSKVPRVGETFFALRRLDKFFDRSPALLEIRVGGIVAKPRRLYVPSTAEVGLGLPVMSDGGELVGITVLQLPDDGSIPKGTGSTLETMGWSARMQEIARGLVLPAADVVRATERAKSTFQKGRAAN